ncbi:hypothetical protein LTR08_007886 [Meristemomyces frigidus]|nr:hypothetical protein LTR08_007886 [Meristemomyces frigidus]
MPLELHPLEEADLDAYVGIMWKAFQTGIMAVMYPNGFSQAARDHHTAVLQRKWRKSPDEIKKMKVVDTDLPADDPFRKIVGVSDWNFYPRARSEDELNAKDDGEDQDGHAPGLNVAFLDAFADQCEKSKKELLGGQPFVLLHILVTLPQYHRRGVGAMHLKWGIERADEMGVPVYLESSPIGRPLYARMGFEFQGWLPADVRDFGAEKELPHALMLRPARAKAI